MGLVSVGDVDLDVEVRGKGEPVVFIQTALIADEFLQVASQPGVREFYQVILYHRRGYGRSSPADGPGSIIRDASDCQALLAILDIERAHIAGFSYSAAIALELAVTAPSLVQTLTVIEPPPMHISDVEEFIAANNELLRLHRREGTRAALDNFLTQLMGSDWREDLESHIPGVVRQVERDAATFFTSDLPAVLSWDLDAEAARHIHQPTLYIGGSQSGPWFAEVRRLMLDWLSPEKDVIVEGADHNLAATHPGQVAHALTDFIGRHPIAP